MESPISASLGAMGSLLRKLDMLLGPSEALLQLHKGAKRWTHLLKDNLEEISSYLQDLSEVEDPPLTAKCWMKEVRELSYDIENYIDSFVLPGHVANIKTRSGRRRRCRRGCRRIRLRHIKITRLLETTKKLNRRKRVAARISDFRIDAREALERHKRYELHCCSGIRPVLLPAAGRLPTTWEEGAGIIIDDRMRKFMDSIAEDKDPQLKVVSVIGSEGIGKTTLVKVLYHKLKGQFDCRAFIRLTRKPDIKTALRDILTQVQQQQQPHNHCEDPDLLSKIREYLQYKRYCALFPMFIVIHNHRSHNYVAQYCLFIGKGFCSHRLFFFSYIG
jgi:hypothetical protein